jgi:Predicted lipoprotein of unknown function (DUF2380)
LLARALDLNAALLARALDLIPGNTKEKDGVRSGGVPDAFFDSRSPSQAGQAAYVAYQTLTALWNSAKNASMGLGKAIASEAKSLAIGIGISAVVAAGSIAHDVYSEMEADNRIASNGVNLPEYHYHHIFPQQYAEEFAKIGIDVHKYTIKIRNTKHYQLHSDGWNEEFGNKMYFEKTSKQGWFKFALKMMEENSLLTKKTRLVRFPRVPH